MAFNDKLIAWREQRASREEAFHEWAKKWGLPAAGTGGGFFYEFPHTHTYDSDLSWLIARMLWVLNRMDDVEQRMAALEDLIDNFIEALNIDEVIRQQIEELIRGGLIEEMMSQYYANVFDLAGARAFSGSKVEFTIAGSTEIICNPATPLRQTISILGGWFEMALQIPRTWFNNTSARISVDELFRQITNNIPFNINGVNTPLYDVIEPVFGPPDNNHNGHFAMEGFYGTEYGKDDKPTRITVYRNNGVEWKNGKYTMQFNAESPPTTYTAYNVRFRIPIKTQTGVEYIKES